MMTEQAMSLQEGGKMGKVSEQWPESEPPDTTILCELLDVCTPSHPSHAQPGVPLQ